MAQLLAAVYADSNVARSLRTVVYAAVALLGTALASAPVQTVLSHHPEVYVYVAGLSAVVNFVLNAIKTKVA